MEVKGCAQIVGVVATKSKSVAAAVGEIVATTLEERKN